MPKESSGNVYQARGKWYARIRVAPGDRRLVPLPTCTSEEQADARKVLLLELVGRMRDKSIATETIARAVKLAGERDGDDLRDVIATVDALCAGRLRPRTASLTSTGPLAEISALPISSAPARPGVYFVRHGGNGPIKIGVAKNIRARLATLQIATPERLSFLGAMLGAGEHEEKQLHGRFAELRERGEWFRPAPELLEHVRAVAQGRA
jgi:hypothetical protein